MSTILNHFIWSDAKQQITPEVLDMLPIPVEVLEKLPEDTGIQGLHKVGNFFTTMLGSVPRIGDIRVSFFYQPDSYEGNVE